MSTVTLLDTENALILDGHNVPVYAHPDTASCISFESFYVFFEDIKVLDFWPKCYKQSLSSSGAEVLIATCAAFSTKHGRCAINLTNLIFLLGKDRKSVV